MAEGWNKITDKADQGKFEGPFASDWEAMNAKIDAQPALNTSPKKGAWWWGVGGVLLMLLSVGIAYWFYDSDQKLMDSSVRENIIEQVSNPQKNNQSITKQNNAEDLVGGQKSISIEERTAFESTNNKSINPEEDLFNVTSNKEEEGLENTVESVKPVKQDQSNENLVIFEVTTDVPLQEEEEKPIEERLEIEPVESIASIENTEVESGSTQNLPESNTEVMTSEEVTNDDAKAEVESEVIAEESPVEEEKVSEEQEEVTVEEIASTMVSRDDEEEEDEIQPVNLRSHGFRMNSISLGGKYLTDYTGDFYGSGVGVDIDIQKGNWLFNTGVSYYSLNRNLYATNTYEKQNYTEIRTTAWDTTVAISPDSVWIIDGPFLGHYVNTSDTTTTIDPTVTSRTDTSTTRITAQEETRVKLSYIEVPLLIGQRFKFNRLAIDLYGGVALSQITSSNQEGGDVSEKFGVSAVLQPGLRYYITEKWSVFGRSGLSYSLVADQFREKKIYSNFHLGLTYHW